MFMFMHIYKVILYGGIAGGAVLLILIIIVVVCVMIRRRRRRRGGDGSTNEQINNKDSGEWFYSYFSRIETINSIHSFNEIVVIAPSNHYQSMHSARMSSNDYERGDIAFGDVKPKSDYERGDIALGDVKRSSEYHQLTVRPSQYDELQLKAPGKNNYVDASFLQ